MQKKDCCKVSVVVPVYNSEDSIGACISSILNQSLHDIEVILVDDGSIDRSGSICDDYANVDNRIVVVHQENMGRSAARLHGTQTACGEWLAFVDSDDTLPDDALSDLYAMSSDDIDIVLGNGDSLKGEKMDTIPIGEFRHMAVRSDGQIGLPWGSLYRRTVVTPYLFDLPREIMNGEDYIFWLRLVFQTTKPVRVLYKNVYNKGEEHTSNHFVWTADYCAQLNEYRMSSIPEKDRHLFMADTIEDRIANLFAVAVCQTKNVWKSSRFFHDILSDMKSQGIGFTWKQRVFLWTPSLKIRQFMASQRL